MTEGAPYGAALLAGVGAGAYGNVAEACDTAIRVTGRTRPGPAMAVYADFYPRHCALYPALAPGFAAMARVVSKHLAVGDEL